uniref:Reverse transcriptase domain-containing protein n=1 Tax=Nicotiana tabacum TaxID=4097 RepID=A0A1S4BLK7_TOBAC|nr:PREDICTED: uncharacterized protein LOC107809627 [Nicotiana tabacum]
MTLSNVSEGMVVAYFQNGLNGNGSRETRKLLSRLMKYPPTIWDEIHNAYCAEVRADEDDLNRPTHRLTSVQAETKKDRRNDAKRYLTAPQSNRERHQLYVKNAIMNPSRHEEGPSRPRTGTHQNERDIPGIPKEVATHRLNVDPFHSMVRQKTAPSGNQNIPVDRHCGHGKKKKNGKWRMCVDFTDLNKACPKESFLLPHIDQLIDATAGHELLSFLHAYSGYNQILMEEKDQEKTTFITPPRNVLLQGDALRTEKRGGDIPKVGDQNV